MDGKKLKEKFNAISNVQYKESIEEAIKSISLNKNDVVIITGSLYLASEVLKIN
jgi:dihydrofolate synthase/folylpolyglutamate synthase